MDVNRDNEVDSVDQFDQQTHQETNTEREQRNTRGRGANVRGRGGSSKRARVHTTMPPHATMLPVDQQPSAASSSQAANALPQTQHQATNAPSQVSQAHPLFPTPAFNPERRMYAPIIISELVH